MRNARQPPKPPIVLCDEGDSIIVRTTFGLELPARFDGAMPRHENHQFYVYRLTVDDGAPDVAYWHLNEQEFKDAFVRIREGVKF